MAISSRNAQKGGVGGQERRGPRSTRCVGALKWECFFEICGKAAIQLMLEFASELLAQRAEISDSNGRDSPIDALDAYFIDPEPLLKLRVLSKLMEQGLTGGVINIELKPGQVLTLQGVFGTSVFPDALLKQAAAEWPKGLSIKG